MIRLVRMVLATFALITGMLLTSVAVDVQSPWAWLAAGVGVWLAVAVAVQLIVSAARPQSVVPQVMFDASPKLTPKQAAELDAAFDAIAKKHVRRGEVR